jgi:hypothetical protein
MTSRLPVTAVVAALTILLAACTSGAATTSRPPTASAATGASGPTTSGAPVLPLPITSEFRVGENRTLFTLLDPAGVNQVAKPDRTLAIGYRGPKGETIASAPQTFIWAIENVNGVYVGHTTFPSAGSWVADFTTEAPGSPKVTLSFSFDVHQTSQVIAPGQAAPSVKTPTVADVGGDLARISSDPTPLKRFYEVSEADALAAKKPFVLIFATPKFCKSAVCGPTLDKLKPVAAAHPEMTFINVEPYQLSFTDGALQPVMTNNDLTPVAATEAFKLVSEPYVFVVGADGKVSASFELVFAPEEIEAAIKAVEAAG